jgi:hypothetical protein
MSFLENQEQQFEKETSLALLSSIQDGVENNMNELGKMSQILNSGYLNTLRSILNIGDSIGKAYKSTSNLHHDLIISIKNEKEKINTENLNYTPSPSKISDLLNDITHYNDKFNKLSIFFETFNTRLTEFFECPKNCFSDNFKDFLTNFDTELRDYSINPNVPQITNNIQTDEFCILLNEVKAASPSRTQSLQSEEPLYEDINFSEFSSKKRKRDTIQKKSNEKDKKIISELKENFPELSSKITGCYINSLKKVTKIKNYIMTGNNISFGSLRSNRFSKLKMTFDVGNLDQEKLNEINLFLKPHLNYYVFIFDKNKNQIVTAGQLSKKSKREKFIDLIEKELLVDKYEVKGVLFEVYYHISEMIFSMKNMISYSNESTKDMNELNLLQLLKRFEEENEINKNILLKYHEIKTKQANI